MAEMNPRNLDAPALQDVQLPTPVAAAPVDAERVPASAALAGTRQEAQGAAQQEQALRKTSSLGASVKAAAGEWSVVRAAEVFSGPQFDRTPGYTPTEDMLGVGQSLSDEEQQFLQESGSTEEFKFRERKLMQYRDTQQTIGDHPIAGFATMMLDPGYIMADMASLGAGRVAALAGASGRAVAGGAAVAANLALGSIEQQVRPVSDAEVVLNALANGAATSMFYTGGRLVRKDPAFPSEELNEVVQKANLTNPDRGSVPVNFVADDVQSPRTGTELMQELEKHFAGTEYDEIYQLIKNAPETAQVRVSTAKEIGEANVGGRTLASQARGAWWKQPREEGTLSRTTGQRGPQGILWLAPDAGIDVALHEMVHAVVENRVRQAAFKPQQAKLEALRASGLNALKYQGKDAIGENAAGFLRSVMADSGEFLTYSLTSPTFRKFLKDVQLLPDGSSAKLSRPATPEFVFVPPAPTALTLWDKVKDMLTSVFGGGKPQLDAYLKKQDAHNAGKAKQAASQKFATWDSELKSVIREVMQGPTPGLISSMKPAGGVSFGNALDIPASVATSIDSIQLSAKIAKNEEAAAEKLGNKLAWNLHKTIASYGAAAKRVADLLVDDPVNMTTDSVVSQTRAIRADLSAGQYKYEDLLKVALANKQAGVRARITSPREAAKVQQAIEQDVAMELLRRERAARLGLVQDSPFDSTITKMADVIDEVNANALAEMQRAGVVGAEQIVEKSGYFSRRWDVTKQDDFLKTFTDAGYSANEAKNKLIGMLAQSMRRANGWDGELSRDIASAVVDRTHRKGYFEDTAFRSHVGNDAAKEVRDILKGAGLSGDRLQKAMDVLTGVTDEAGKVPVLKHRVELDMKAGTMLPDGRMFTVAELIDTNMGKITDRYLDTVAGQSALARKGLSSVTEIAKLRTSMLEDISSETARAEAANLFDQTINAVLGRPTGEDMPEFMRKAQSVNRMVGLASSALWQITEYATIMQRFGALKTLKYTLKEMPGARQVFNSSIKDKGAATDLRNILARNSSQDIRIRPYIQRMEDNFEVAVSNHLQLALTQAEQLVPYINGMKYIQHHQARVSANLIVDVFEKAARGDVRAQNMLNRYGLESGSMQNIASEIKEFGGDTTKWSDGTWETVRGPMTKMMDDAVLRNRTGEIPAFAQFSALGKFVFTFRSFVLGAHNKILAGGLAREGFGGTALLMAYQLPLAMMATAANATIQGKPVEDEEELIKKAISQMGALGLLSEVWGVASGQKEQFGAPGLIAIDRLYKIGSSAANMEGGDTAANALSAVPLISIVPGVRAIGETLKGE